MFQHEQFGESNVLDLPLVARGILRVVDEARVKRRN